MNKRFEYKINSLFKIVYSIAGIIFLYLIWFPIWNWLSYYSIILYVAFFTLAFFIYKKVSSKPSEFLEFNDEYMILPWDHEPTRIVYYDKVVKCERVSSKPRTTKSVSYSGIYLDFVDSRGNYSDFTICWNMVSASDFIEIHRFLKKKIST